MMPEGVRPTPWQAAWRGLTLLVLACALCACGAPPRQPSVPAARQLQASVPGLPGIRYRAPDFDGLKKDLVITVQRERATLKAAGYDGPLKPISFLALSGGGADGAFGAGLLVGWTQRGDRPEFNLVTGVSTGALIAPFAFLGPQYDTQLKRLYTEISDKDILQLRSLVAALFDDALADNLPLQKLVEANITQEVLDAIAAESLKGRTLLVGTTDLDARRSVYWNLTLDGRVAPPAGAAADPQDPGGVGGDSGRTAAGHDRCRGGWRSASRKCTSMAAPRSRCSCCPPRW